MRRAYSVDDVRAAEQEVMATLPRGTLMARAAAGLAATCVGRLGGGYGRRVVLLVGGGDNGGDALFAGALLARRGARADALLVGSAAHPDGRRALRAAGGDVLALGPTAAPADLDEAGRRLARADLVVDGVTGIGGTGPLRAHVADLLRLVPADAVVVAVDVPSGVDAGTGEVAGAHVTADVTVTFGVQKPALLVDPGAAACGDVVLVDIGVADRLVHRAGSAPVVDSLDVADVAALLRPPAPDDDKYSRGVVGVLAGSDRYPGAAVLTVGGAQAAGAGMVRFAGGAAAAAAVRQSHPEALVTDLDVVPDPVAVGRVQSWVAGPGAGTDDVALDRLRAVLASDVPVVLDADAVTLVAAHPDLVVGRTAATVLTPHAGELARLLGVERADVEARRLEHVREAQRRSGATVLLKGSTTLVASGSTVRANPRPPAWLATAGAGDVLSGVVGALLAQGLGPHDAASVGAWLHGRAAAEASAAGPLPAARIGTALPAVLARVLQHRRAAQSPT